MASSSREYRRHDPAAGIRIRYGPGPEQFGDLRLPAGAGPHPIAVVIHGGWWRAMHDLGNAAHLAEALRSDGFASWNVEYRRVGNEGGGYPGTLEDVVSAAAALESLAAAYPLDLSRIVVVGHSAGGQLATWLAAKDARRELDRFGRSPRVHGVVSVAGALDLKQCSQRGIGSRGVPVHDFLGGTWAEIPDLYALTSPVELVPIGVPTVVVHGTADENVPYDLAETYVERARRAGDNARLVRIDGADHFTVMDPDSPAGARVRDAVRTLVSA